jgi:hypothetical protein
MENPLAPLLFMKAFSGLPTRKIGKNDSADNAFGYLS